MPDEEQLVPCVAHLDGLATARNGACDAIGILTNEGGRERKPAAGTALYVLEERLLCCGGKRLL